MICKNCGKEFEGKFCPECGISVEGEGIKSSGGSNGGVDKFLSIFAKVYRWLIAGGMLLMGFIALICLCAPTLVEDFLGEDNPLCIGFVAIGNGVEVDVTPTVVNASIALLALSLLAIVYGGVQLYFSFKKPYAGIKKYVLWCIDGIISSILIILGGVVAGETNSEELMDAKLGSGFTMCIVMGVFGLLFLGARIFYELKVFEIENLNMALSRDFQKSFKWKFIDEKTIRLTGYNGTLKEVTVPSTINEYSVECIGDYAFSDCGKLSEIKMPNSITKIGKYAFNDCNSLTSLVLSDCVTSIEDYAFYRCNSLANIKLPNVVCSLGDFAFAKCSKLSEINIPGGVTEIGKYTFYNCNSLASLDLPNAITCIGERAFEFCSSLEQIYIPNSVESIGSLAFYNCTSLVSIYIPKSVTRLGSNAFLGCNNLTIYCEVDSQPNGWDSDWNPSNRPIVWKYTK